MAQRAKKKRRTKTQHEGVKLRRRTWASGAETWFGRWRCPDTGREVDTNLNKLGLTTKETRESWAKSKSRQIKARAAKLDAETPEDRERREAREQKKPLDQAIEEYLGAAKTRSAKPLRENTLEIYERALGIFKKWCEDQGILHAQDLSKGDLARFKEYLSSMPKLEAKAGAKRGKRKTSKKRLEPVSINKNLRAIKTLLFSWNRKEYLVESLTRDRISDCLSALETPRPVPDFLKPRQIRRLLEAALAHDAETFELTREEKKGKRPAGSTPRYAPIAPFVAAALLTGARFGELLAMDWSMVDLMAASERAEAGGEIVLSPQTKTKRGRWIDLAVSPGLRRILAALKDQSRGASVFGLDRWHAESSRKRLIKSYEAPPFGWNKLRRTCACFLVNAPAIYGGASLYRAARQLGHSAPVAVQHYLEVVRGIPRDARTLEAAMGLEDLLERMVAGLSESRIPDSGQGKQRPA